MGNHLVYVRVFDEESNEDGSAGYHNQCSGNVSDVVVSNVSWMIRECRKPVVRIFNADDQLEALSEKRVMPGSLSSFEQGLMLGEIKIQSPLTPAEGVEQIREKIKSFLES